MWKLFLVVAVFVSSSRIARAEAPSENNPIMAELVGDQVSQVFTAPGITWYDCIREMDHTQKEGGCSKAIGWLSKQKKNMTIKIVGPKIKVATYDPIAVAQAEEGQTVDSYLEEYYPVRFSYDRRVIEMEDGKFRYVKLKAQPVKKLPKGKKPRDPAPPIIEEEVWIDKRGNTFEKEKNGEFKPDERFRESGLTGFTPVMKDNPNYNANGRIGYVRASSIRCKPTDANNCDEFNQTQDPEQKELVERLTSDEAPSKFRKDCKRHLEKNPVKMKNQGYRRCMQEHADELINGLQPQVNEIYKRIVKHVSYCNALPDCLEKLKQENSSMSKGIPCDSCLSKTFDGFSPFKVKAGRQKREEIQITPDVLQKIDRLARTGFGEMASCNKFGTQFMAAYMRVALNRALDKNSKNCKWEGKEPQKEKDLLSKIICSPGQFNVWMTSGTNPKYTHNPSLKNALCPIRDIVHKETEHDLVEDFFQDTTAQPYSKERIKRLPTLVSWRLTLKNAIEAVVFREEFLSRTDDMNNLYFYTSARHRFGKFSHTEATLSGRPVSKFECFNLWENKNGLACQKNSAQDGAAAKKPRVAK